MSSEIEKIKKLEKICNDFLKFNQNVYFSCYVDSEFVCKIDSFAIGFGKTFPDSLSALEECVLRNTTFTESYVKIFFTERTKDNCSFLKPYSRDQIFTWKRLTVGEKIKFLSNENYYGSPIIDNRIFYTESKYLLRPNDPNIYLECIGIKE